MTLQKASAPAHKVAAAQLQSLSQGIDALLKWAVADSGHRVRGLPQKAMSPHLPELVMISSLQALHMEMEHTHEFLAEEFYDALASHSLSFTSQPFCSARFCLALQAAARLAGPPELYFKLLRFQLPASVLQSCVILRAFLCCQQEITEGRGPQLSPRYEVGPQV